MMEYWNVGIFSSILITHYSKLKFSIDIQTSFDMMGQIMATNEPPRGKPLVIFKGRIHFIAASCGKLNPVNFASLSK
jgi:hypothetical protein